MKICKEFNNFNLNEFDVFAEHLLPNLPKLKENVEYIIYYGFTEMFNNAIDHSESSKIYTIFTIKNNRLYICIRDDGIGIFKNIKKYLNLDNESDAILELFKGKITTKPENHSGQGIFFTSRAFDIFAIFSGGYHFKYSIFNDDIASSLFSFGHKEDEKGTGLVMAIDLDSSKDMGEIFNKYTSDDDNYEFNTTKIHASIIALNGHLIARSQAKKLVFRLENFQNIIIDFFDVKFLHQGFADEVFRVFRLKHPHVTITYLNANDQVDKMIKKAQAEHVRYIQKK